MKTFEDLYKKVVSFDDSVVDYLGFNIFKSQVKIEYDMYNLTDDEKVKIDNLLNLIEAKVLQRGKVKGITIFDVLQTYNNNERGREFEIDEDSVVLKYPLKLLYRSIDFCNNFLSSYTNERISEILTRVLSMACNSDDDGFRNIALIKLEELKDLKIIDNETYISIYRDLDKS